MGRRVVLVLVAAMPMLVVAGAGWDYAAARSTAAANEGAPAAALRLASPAVTPAPGTPDGIALPHDIDRGFWLPAPSCSIDPGFHLRIPDIEQIDPGFGPVPSPPPALPRCSGTPTRATPTPRP